MSSLLLVTLNTCVMGNKIIIYSLGFVLLVVQRSYSQCPINKGLLLLENGKFSQDEVFFESFMKTNLLNETGILCFGRAVGFNGNLQKAKEIFGKLLYDDSNNSIVQLGLANT